VISTANLSQLAADLLIASLQLERIGVFDPKNLVPIVGARESGEEGITVPLESMNHVLLSNTFICSNFVIYATVYGRDDMNICVIQQRSPALKVSSCTLVIIGQPNLQADEETRKCR
jgi:proteasome assembly chaperone 2